MMTRAYIALLKSSGAILLLAAFILGYVSLHFYSLNMSVFARVLCFIFGGLIGFLGAFLVWRGSQYHHKLDAESILSDHKPHVLYLRSFRSDPSFPNYDGVATMEERLADVLQPFGDLVAIGQPGERLPKPGAARMYASEEEWKEVVKRQILAARLVIIRAGEGKNLLWELKQAVETLNPQKLLILVLDMKAKDYESFRTNVKSVLGVSLPEGTTMRRHREPIRGFIGFGADWKPNVFPLRVPYMYFRCTSSTQPSFFDQSKFALRPVFESFGLEWQPPPDWQPMPRIIQKLVESVRTFFHHHGSRSALP
jgi:hypothetical protein